MIDELLQKLDLWIRTKIRTLKQWLVCKNKHDWEIVSQETFYTLYLDLVRNGKIRSGCGGHPLGYAQNRICIRCGLKDDGIGKFITAMLARDQAKRDREEKARALWEK